MLFARRVLTATAAGLLLLFLLPSSIARAEWVWDNDSGWIDMSERPEQTDRGQYAYARGLFIRGDYAASLDAFRGVEEKYPDSPYAGKAKFGRALAEARMGRLDRAANISNQILKEKPAGVSIEQVAAFHLETVRKLFPTRPQFSAALLKAASQNIPSRPLLYQAHMELARAAISSGNYDEAAQLFEAAMETAGDAAEKDPALFGTVVADLMMSGRAGHNAVLTRRAEARLRGLLKESPQGALAEKAQEYLWLIESVLSEENPEKRQVYYEAIGWVTDQSEVRYSRLARYAKRFSGSTAGEVARFYQAECLFGQGRYWTVWPWRWSAFEAYEKFVKQYPASKRLRTVVAMEYQIGKSFAEDGAHSRAVAVMDAVARNYPAGPLADDAYMAAGRAELAMEHFANARAAFDAVAEGYPRSEWNSAAVYMGAVTDMRHTRFANDNEMLLARARRALEVYLKNVPDGAFADEAKALLEECKEKQGRDLLRIAGFYDRRRQPDAAAAYYRHVVRDFPETASSASARRALERLGVQDQAER